MLPELQPIATKLQNERAKLLAVLDDASEPQRIVTIYEEGWNLYDLVSHLASAEKENVRFLRQLLSENRARHLPQDGAFTLDEWNARAVGKRAGQSWDARRAELDEARRVTLETLEAISAEQFAHSGTHAVWGEQSVEVLLKIIYLHDIMHRKDVARRLKDDERRTTSE